MLYLGVLAGRSDGVRFRFRLKKFGVFYGLD
ncbi:hypothetical protein J2X41_004595 [Caulobacter sp. BE254]|nr:hypothetical protein [Caulobacter sp. BE254]